MVASVICLRLLLHWMRWAAARIALHRRGLESRIRLTVPHFNVLPEILARSELAAIVPLRPALRFAQHYGLNMAEPPLGLPPLQVGLHWSWRMGNDPGHRWLRDTLAQLYGESALSRKRR